MTTTRARRVGLAPWVGLLVALTLVVLAFGLPRWLGWEVAARAPRSASDREVPPLHGLWEPKLLGPGTLPAVVLAVLGWRYAAGLAARLPWRRLLLTSYVAGLAWLLALALVDGASGLTRVLGNDYEYLPTAREVDDVGALVAGYVERIPYAHEDNWVTHVAGHPPGALLVFVLLVRVGLGGDLAAALVVVAIAATTSLAVLTTLRALGVEDVARRAAPFLVLTPAAVFMAVSADALFAAVAAWGVAALALAASAARAARRGPAVAWSALAGLLLGYGVLLSYGLPLLGLVALAVLLAARAWLPLPVAAVTALGVVLAFAAAGFAWWEAYPVLTERYWEGIAADRPAAYWMWANLAALLLCAGPLLAAGLAHTAVVARRASRPAVLLVASACAAVVAADLSRMSKGEVERIWLLFVPWLTISLALLPPAWRRWGLALQLAAALVVQHLFYTSW